MHPMVTREHRFATFVLDRKKGIEFAIRAEDVLEATPVTGSIQPLPSGVAYLEGYMHLRDDAIPVINMKKRLGLSITDYAADAKVAVIATPRMKLGLLFDDIRDVLMVEEKFIDPVHPALRGHESIVSDLIKLDQGRRTIELLDLKRILGDAEAAEQIQAADRHRGAVAEDDHCAIFRFVVFSSAAQDYGVPVDQVQEITFLSEIDDVFQHDTIEGAVQLRGNAIPVINAARLLQENRQDLVCGEETRVLVLNADTFQYGLIVDTIREILSIPETAILPLPLCGRAAVCGICQRPEGGNIMLIQVDTLIDEYKQELRSVARLISSSEEKQADRSVKLCRHLITAACYLVFSIGKNFAIELSDVQEIIEPEGLMDLPATTGYDHRILNLRGSVLPVINLRAFYGYADDTSAHERKLIIARNRSRVVALEVDRILTIYKQVQYKQTPSLNPQLAGRKDTLDRLIEFIDESGTTEHVLVVNVAALIDNYLGMTPITHFPITAADAKERKHANLDRA